MIVGNVSVDPRRVLNFEYDRRSHTVEIDCAVGEGIRTITAYFSDSEEAWAAMAHLDRACYKGPLADAVADKTIEDDKSCDCEQERLGFV